MERKKLLVLYSAVAILIILIAVGVIRTTDTEKTINDKIINETEINKTEIKEINETETEMVKITIYGNITSVTLGIKHDTFVFVNLTTTEGKVLGFNKGKVMKFIQ